VNHLAESAISAGISRAAGTSPCIARRPCTVGVVGGATAYGKAHLVRYSRTCATRSAAQHLGDVYAMGHACNSGSGATTGFAAEQAPPPGAAARCHRRHASPPARSRHARFSSTPPFCSCQRAQPTSFCESSQRRDHSAGERFTGAAPSALHVRRQVRTSRPAEGSIMMTAAPLVAFAGLLPSLVSVSMCCFESAETHCQASQSP
jgi:hypothetical protein